MTEVTFLLDPPLAQQLQTRVINIAKNAVFFAQTNPAPTDVMTLANSGG
jgi:hypothetical protein